jgi:hypothetical protein
MAGSVAPVCGITWVAGAGAPHAVSTNDKTRTMGISCKAIRCEDPLLVFFILPPIDKNELGKIQIRLFEVMPALTPFLGLSLRAFEKQSHVCLTGFLPRHGIASLRSQGRI